MADDDTNEGKTMTTTTFRLDPQVVEEIFDATQGNDIEVDAIVSTARFDGSKLKLHAELIGAMLLELPEQFRQSAGGGWSFLNACMDRHGNQWTGMHATMAKLFAMGEALGLVQCQLPRELWEALPGGMPYYVVLDGKGRFD